VTRLYDRCGEHALRGPNDIVFDRQGGFWFSELGTAFITLSQTGRLVSMPWDEPGLALNNAFPLQQRGKDRKKDRK
jgi:sugar lactone lactonase YvrE